MFQTPNTQATNLCCSVIRENLNYLICLLVVYSCYHQPPALIFFDRFRIAALATWFWDLEPCSSHIAHHCTTWMLLRHQVHQSDSCDFDACDQDWIKNFATDVFHPEAAKKWCVGRKTDGSRNRCCSGSISPKQCSSWGRTNLRFMHVLHFARRMKAKIVDILALLVFVIWPKLKQQGRLVSMRTESHCHTALSANGIIPGCKVRSLHPEILKVT